MKPTITLLAAALPATMFAAVASADCSNLVLNLKDQTSGREITTILNCHEPSASIPGASTMHFMEWKGGQLCRSIQVCGNVNYWRGNISVGAQWYWGNEVSKFKQTVDSWNRFANQDYNMNRSAEAEAGGGRYACASADEWMEMERGGYVRNTTGYYFDESAYGNATATHGCEQTVSSESRYFNASFREWCEFSRSNGYAVNRGYYMNSERGSEWLGRYGASRGILSCGYLNRNYSESGSVSNGGVMGLENGKLKTVGASNTNWSMDGIQASMSLDFGQIKRSCSKVQDFGCM
jgi:hypothetical protein